MVKPKEPPAIEPSLSTEQAIEILEGLILSSENLHDEPSSSEERKQWAHTGEGAVLAAFGSQHPNIQKFRVANSGGVYHPSMGEANYKSRPTTGWGAWSRS